MLRESSSPFQTDLYTSSTPDAGLRTSPTLLHQLFELHADRTPNQVAVVGDGVEWTYSELERRSNQLAHYLRSLELKPGTFVGLLCERSARPIVAILACLKAGTAYVPIDPSHPKERLSHILEEASIRYVFTDETLAGRVRELGGEPLILETLTEDLPGMPQTRPDPDAVNLQPENICYVIFTSGTTGRPKGVMAEHRGVVAYAHAFNDVCTTVPDDRIYQGFALGFDGSVEEMWMAFSNGATLVVGTPCTAKFGDDAAAYLIKHGVTYFSTVPTCLATMSMDIPSLRQIVLSGERCPPELVEQWARSGRTILNVYGPTEATVNTTAKECRPGEPVTIGRALSGYDLHILDEDLNPVAPGEKGELFIGGITLARGYLNRPDLTDKAFLNHSTLGRIYRTGDLVRQRDDGELEFFGRIDGQVKIRGYRVELGEIEAVLGQHPGIATAVVKLFERDGVQELGAFCIQADEKASIDRERLLSHLKSHLPDYMIPRYLDMVDSFPRLPSGKVNRKILPRPVTPLISENPVDCPPEGDMEKAIAKVWAKAFGVDAVSAEANFFSDLGGHSLLAAQTVTRLRTELGCSVAVRDTYRFPTVRSLAKFLDENRSIHTDPNRPKDPQDTGRLSRKMVPRWEKLTVQGLQALTILGLHGLLAAPFVLFIGLLLATSKGIFGIWTTVGLLAGLSFVMWPLVLALSIAAKWILIGRYKAGRHGLWSFMYFRWWLAGKFQAMSGAGFLVGTPAFSIYARLMGARIGRNCHFDSGFGTCWDLISIGDDTSIGADTQYLGYRVEGDELIFGRIEIGSRCFVGIHCNLGLGVRMNDDTRLGDKSLLADGQSLSKGTSWQGSPLQNAEVPVPEGPLLRQNRWQRFRLLVTQLIFSYLLGLCFGIIGLASLAAVISAFWFYGIQGGLITLALAVPVGLIVTMITVAIAYRILVGGPKPGVYPIASYYYIRKWLANGLIRGTRAALLPVFTTLYLPPFLRLLGTKVGRRAELSTLWSFSPELLDIGAESFFADGSMVGGRRVFGGRFELGWNRIGTRTFVGNSAFLPVGTSLGDECLLGVASVPPADRAVENGKDWLGSPSFALPNRQKVGNFVERLTYHPSRRLYLQRACIDALRIFIPSYLGLGLFILAVYVLIQAFLKWGWTSLFWVSPVLAFSLGIVAIMAVVGLKWLVMGRFHPVVKPLWSMYVWLNEMVNGSYESVMAPALTPYLGTPFAAPFLRALGCRIGRNVFLNTTLFSEFDLVDIGDGAALNFGAVIQNHLFEDRVMKSSYLRVGDGCTVGNMGVVLYDSEMQQGSALGPLSLLMKGEVLPANTRWLGIPCVSADSVANDKRIRQ